MMNTGYLSTKRLALRRAIRVMGALVLMLAIAVSGVSAQAVSGQGEDGKTPEGVSPASVENPRVYANLTEDSIRYEYTDPGAEVTFSIYTSPGGTLLWEESRTADDSGFAIVTIWDFHFELEQGMYIVVSAGNGAKNLRVQKLSLDVFDPEGNVLSGTAFPGRRVWAVANNDTVFCGMNVTADSKGQWTADFNAQNCDVTADMTAYAQVFDREDDTTEANPDFIDGTHGYDHDDVPSWACNAGGWAVDTDDRDRDLEVRALSDGVEVTRMTADQQTDLLGICGADGTCGYEFHLWGLITSYKTHEITVQAYDQETGQWFDLNGTPKSLTCRTYDIYTYDTLTGKTRQVTNLRGADEYNPQWSPDGKKIVFDIVKSDGSLGTYVVDVDTRVSKPLAGAKNGGNDPAWSPNGKWIVFDRYWVEDSSLYQVPAAGGTRKLLRKDAIMASWSPDSTRIVFTRPSDWSIWTMNRWGGDVKLVVRNGMIPAWSPDGRWIAFVRDGDIWKIRVNSSGARIGSPIRMTSIQTDDSRPTWSPDSKTIAFHAGINRDYDIWTIPAGGGMATWLTGAPQFGDYDPDYSYDGRYIAYSSFSPAGQAARTWVSAYTHDFPAGFWSEGTHTYRFDPDQPGDQEFNISSQADLYDGFVLLRPGSRWAKVGEECITIDAVHPDQPTRADAGYTTEVDMTYTEAQAFFDELAARIVWDGSNSAALEGHEILPFTSLDGWFEAACTFTQP